MQKITIDGESRTARAWANHPDCCVSYQTIYNRLSAGWDAKEAVFAPSVRGTGSGTRVSGMSVTASSPGGQMLLDWLNAHGYDAKDAARALDVSLSTVLNLITGKSVTYSMVFKTAMLLETDAIQLAHAFGLGTDFFVGD